MISNFTGKEYIKIKNIYFFYQGYGLTETTSTAAITEEDDISVGLVGAPLQGTNDEHVRKKMLTSCFTKKDFFFLYLGVDIKLVSWNEGNYSITDSVGPRGEIHIGNYIINRKNIFIS